MAWKLEIDGRAQRDLDRLDPVVAKRIIKFLFERLSMLEDPRSIGEALKGARLGNYWRYRVGDYRIVASIEDEAIRILVLRIANRREVYR